MQDFPGIILAIVKEQEGIIGPLAVEQANQVEGLVVDTTGVKFKGDPLVVLERLVEGYKQVFGSVSVEVCREAVHKVVGSGDRSKLPQMLQ